MNKKNIQYILEYQEEIESINNVFENDLFIDLLDILYASKQLEKNEIFNKEDMHLFNNWNQSKNDKHKSKIITELFKYFL